MADAGLTFSPLNTTPGMAAGRGPNTVQDAIKLLSFRIPTTGQTASPLLGPATGGMPGLGAGPQGPNFLMQLIQGLINNPGSQTPMAAPMGAPRPSVQLPQANVPQAQAGSSLPQMGHPAVMPVPQIPGGYQPFPGGYPMGGGAQ